MSRSLRKTPVFANARSSEKQDKQLANRRMRRKVNQTDHLSEPIYPIMDEIGNLWTFAKDGKHYWKDAPKKSMRK